MLLLWCVSGFVLFITVLFCLCWCGSELFVVFDTCGVLCRVVFVLLLVCGVVVLVW